MLFLPSGYTTKDKGARQHVVSTKCECLFDGNKDEIEMVCQEMEAEKDSWQIHREKGMYKVR